MGKVPPLPQCFFSKSLHTAVEVLNFINLYKRLIIDLLDNSLYRTRQLTQQLCDVAIFLFLVPEGRRLWKIGSVSSVTYTTTW